MPSARARICFATSLPHWSVTSFCLDCGMAWCRRSPPGRSAFGPFCFDIRLRARSKLCISTVRLHRITFDFVFPTLDVSCFMHVITIMFLGMRPTRYPGHPSIDAVWALHPSWSIIQVGYFCHVSNCRLRCDLLQYAWNFTSLFAAFCRHVCLDIRPSTRSWLYIS